MSKILTAYYSRRGENYVGGTVRNLPRGNTEYVAGRIAAFTGCDLFQIETKEKYPENYTAMTEVAMQELQAEMRPELVSSVADMSRYDTIILGYPNWWGTMPMCVFTFLESYDFTGKTILPFCTHEGSGLGHSMEDMRRLCPGVEVKDGLAIRGSSVASSDKLIEEWLKRNGI